jgi:streptogramin lyase
MTSRVMQEVTFDSKGNVWITEPRKVSAISWLDPRTGDQKTYPTPNPIWAPHGIAIDADDTVWFAGLKAGVVHFDPKTGNWDTFGKTAESHKDMGGLTPFLDSKGNVYWTDIRFNKLGRLDRKTREWKYYDSPTVNGSPYGGLVDRQDRFWHAEFHACAISQFDPATGKTKAFKSPSYPCLIRRPGLDSKGNIWYGVYDRGRIEKLDPNTGKVTQFQIPVKFATPYDTWVDPSDNVWTSSNNYFVRLNPDTGTLSYFPTPEKTDMPKMTITRDGAVWFPARSHSPASVGVLYPDKAKMKTFAAYFSPNDPNAIAIKGKVAPMKIAGNGNDGSPGMPKKAASSDEPHKDLGAAAE